MAMTRTEKMLEGLDLGTAVGLEVGALCNPIVPPATPGIFYVDHVDTPALREKYKDHPHVDLEKLVEVNGVWGEKTLAEAAAAVTPVDFFVASHVIEHVPNLIGWLQEIATVLKPGGQVRLAIPDRRYTFDLLRRETGLADVLAAYLVKARTPQTRQIIDHIENVVRVDAERVWNASLDRRSLVKHHTADDMFRVLDDIRENGAYHDVHCWVFTPHSFAELMGRLADLEYHSFACQRFHDTEYNTYEFIVSMQSVAQPSVAAASWRALAERIEESESEKAIRSAKTQQEEEIEHLRCEIDRLNRDVAEIRRSTSWRVTVPLRALRRMFR